MKARILYLLKTYLLTVLCFVAAKVVFMLCYAETPHWDASAPATDMADVVWHGLTLDLSTALYILIVPFLCTVASIFIGRARILCHILRAYYAVIATAMALAFVADTSLYEFWQFKLDASCLQYIETPTEAMASVSWSYMLIRLIVLLLTAVLIYLGYTRPHWKLSPSRHRLAELLTALACIPIIIIGIRGGLDESTTNIGQVYYSQNQFLNHAAVNPVFSFLSSFEKTANNIVDYDYYSPQECSSLMEGLYPTESQATDSLLNTRRPNIVIVLMESAGDLFANVMPNLQRLKREGVDFTNCYGNTWRTDRGTVCTYSGYPSFPTSSVMKMPKKTYALPGIAASLREQGYRTAYLYGGDINFTNMRSYLVATGWERLMWKADYGIEEQHSAQWGVRDDITFNTLYRWITTQKEQPFLMGFSTLSSHEPWDVPVRKYREEKANAFYYLDRCIGDFIGKLKRTPQWHNLLVIFLPDHSIDYEKYTETVQERNRIPMVWVGGAVKQPRQITALCNQTDLAATLLAQLGLPHSQFRWSRDVMSSNYCYPFAVHNYNNGFSLCDSTGFMVYDLNSQRIIVDKSSDAQRMERIGKAILQATTEDLKKR